MDVGSNNPLWALLTLPSLWFCDSEPQSHVNDTQFLEGTAARADEQNQSGIPKLEALLGKREVTGWGWKQSAGLSVACWEKRTIYYLWLACREWTSYIIFIDFSLFSKKFGLLSSCLQVKKITSLSARNFSSIFWKFCLGSQTGVLLMTPWLLKPDLASNQVLAIGFTYRENAHKVLFLWKQQKLETLWVRNVQFCISVEAFIQELLPLLPSGVVMPISHHPWRKHQVPETPRTAFLACSCGGYLLPQPAPLV